MADAPSIPLPPHFAALIFDCDGTLVDTAPVHFHALQQALALQGHTMERAWYYQRLGLSPHDLLNEHEAALREASQPSPAGHPSPQLDRTAYYAVYDRFYQAGLEHLREQQLVADLARAWHTRVPMAVASNGHRENVRASLRTAGLLTLFSHVVTIDDVTHGKPAPDIFLEAARRLAAPPTACVVLEDSDEGLAGARAAGMHAIDVRPLLHPSA